MSKAIPLFRHTTLRWLAPLATFLALVALLVAMNREPQADPVAALGPQVDTAPAAATADGIETLEGAVRADPDSSAALASLGDAYLQAARDTADPLYLERADAAFASALGRDPDSVVAVIGQGTVALAGHEFSRGLELGLQAHRMEPDLVRPYAIIVDANVELGRYGDAGRALERMLALKPTLASYSRASYFRELNGDLDGATEAMRLAVSAGGGSVEGSAYVQRLLGNLQLLRGHTAAAEHAFSGALFLDPEYAPAIAGRAKVALTRGDFGAAISGYREAVAGLPNAENATGLADALNAAGRSVAAERAYDDAITIARADPVEVNQELALLELDHGSLARGVETARQAWRLAPGAKSAEALAWALHRTGQSGRALPLARRAVVLHSGAPEVLYRSARVAIGAGAADQARRWLEQAVSIDPSYDSADGPSARHLLARVS